jgi:hypothetical protein
MMRKAYKVLVGKRDGKETLGRLRRRWEGNIKIRPYLKATECEDMC